MISDGKQVPRSGTSSAGIRRKNRSPQRPEAPRINETESPLSTLRHRLDGSGAPLLGDAEFAAGERLRADYTLGQMQPRVTIDWEFAAATGASRRSGHDGAPDLTARSLAARARLFAALDAVGPELSTILLEVCCLSAGLEQAERRLGLPVRSGKAVLRMALTRLARHYGLLPRETAELRHPALHHWARPNYRPRLTP